MQEYTGQLIKVSTSIKRCQIYLQRQLCNQSLSQSKQAKDSLLANILPEKITYAATLSWDITTARLTQPCIPLGSLNRVPASAGSIGGKVTAAGWQVKLCDPTLHVISRSGLLILIKNCYIRLTYLYMVLF